MGYGGGEGCVRRLMTAAVERAGITRIDFGSDLV
jgi:hypothetical protein